jgi:hypothetical protein
MRPMRKYTVLRMLVSTTLMLTVGISQTVWAQGVPVMVVTVQERAPSAAVVARVVSAIGTDARHGTALTTTLAERFGRFTPQDDSLQPQREAITRAVDVFFNTSPERSRPRFLAAIGVMEQSRNALELREDNRASYLRALMMLARVETESARPNAAAADVWLQRALAFDPVYTPTPHDYPPTITDRYPQLRAMVVPAGRGHITVRTPREGCVVRVDDQVVSGDSRERSVEVTVATHRVRAECGEPSRVRSVTVAANATVELYIDPRLDAAVQTSGDSSLVYVRASDVTEHLGADAAMVGQVLGAHHVVVVDADNIRVIDVATHAVNTTIASNVTDLDTPIRLDARLRTAFSGTPVATLPTAEPPQSSAGSVAASGSGAGVWPWIVAGTGVALLGTGIALNFMHNAEQSSLVSMCNDRGEQVVCPTSLATRGDDIATLNTARVATLVAGGALVVGGVVWWLLDRPRTRSTAASVRVVPLLSIESVGISGRF